MSENNTDRTGAAAIETGAQFSIQERDDDMLIVDRDWQFGARCIARRPKLMRNEEWRPVAERIVAALAPAPASSDPVAWLEAETLRQLENSHVVFVETIVSNVSTNKRKIPLYTADTIASAVASATAGRGAVVKPLEWDEPSGHGISPLYWAIGAKSPIKNYRIDWEGYGLNHTDHPGPFELMGIGSFSSVEAGKAAAQNDYEQRIRSACTIQPALAAERTAREAAERQVEALRAALEEVRGCFNAAECEGLTDRLMELDVTEVGSLADLVQRRLLYADAVASAVLSAHPAPETAPARDEEEHFPPPEGYGSWRYYLDNPPPPTPALVALMKEYYANQKQARDGWRLVPVVPTWEMQIAGRNAIIEEDDTLDISTDDADAAYRAMLAASPKPEHGGNDGR